jgi:hypothetical protein
MDITTAARLPERGHDTGAVAGSRLAPLAPAPAAGPAGTPWTGWLVLGVLLALEWALFAQYARRDIVWAYPTSYDQSQYLAGAYETYETILAKGLGPGLWDAAARRAPQGMMLRPQAGLLFLLTGPSRLGALSLNFAYFALLQGTLAGTLLALSRRWAVALFGVGLLLAATTPFSWPGGMADFRLDFLAFCLFGVFICLVVRARVFEDWGWSLAAGSAGALLVLFRFLCMVYLGGILGVTFLFLAVALWLGRRDAAVRGRRLRRLGGLAIAGAVLLALTLPVLWHNRSAIYDYYGVGHVLGPEKLIRAREFGADGLWARLLYYPRSLAGRHLGTAFLVLGALTVLAALPAAWVLRRRVSSPGPVDGRATGLFLAACLLVPLTALTLDVGKSPVVGNVLAAPAVWLVLLPVLLLTASLPAGAGPRPLRWGLAVLAVLGVGTGVWTQFQGFSEASPLRRCRADAEQVVRLFDAIARYSGEVGWAAPRISVDAQHDYTYPLAAAPLAYERHHLLLEPQARLGGIFAVTEDEAVRAVLDSDFVVLTTHTELGESASPYPFDRSMQEVRPRLAALCRERFVPLQRFHFYWTDVVLYARPAVKVEGASGGWITSQGCTLTGRARMLRAFPHIELAGQAPADRLPTVPGVRAVLQSPGEVPTPVLAALTFSGNAYRLTLTLDPRKLPADGPATVQLGFDGSFVPRDLGLNGDTRQLVVRAPSQVTLAAAP